MLNGKCSACKCRLPLAIGFTAKGKCQNCGVAIKENQSRAKLLVATALIFFLSAGSIPLPYYFGFCLLVSIFLSPFRIFEIDTQRKSNE
jgi:hypothetical protein